jgi:hypothetical protein
MSALHLSSMTTPLPGWKLALLQHSRASSMQSSPARSDRSSIDFQDSLYALRTLPSAKGDDATDMIRELAVDLLDSVSKGGKRLGRTQREAGTPPLKESEQHGTEGHDGPSHNAALSQAPTIPQSMAVSPSARAGEAEAQARALPGDSPIRCFTPSSPNSVTSSTPSERKRRTRRSSARSADADDLSLREVMRSRSALGHRRDETDVTMRDSPNVSVHFTVGEDGGQQHAVWAGSRTSSRSRSPTRPKSSGSGPAYLQPSESYLRSLQEPRPKTPGSDFFMSVSVSPSSKLLDRHTRNANW